MKVGPHHWSLWPHSPNTPAHVPLKSSTFTDSPVRRSFWKFLGKGCESSPSASSWSRAGTKVSDQLTRERRNSHPFQGQAPSVAPTEAPGAPHASALERSPRAISFLRFTSQRGFVFGAAEGAAVLGLCRLDLCYVERFPSSLLLPSLGNSPGPAVWTTPRVRGIPNGRPLRRTLLVTGP